MSADHAPEVPDEEQEHDSGNDRHHKRLNPSPHAIVLLSRDDAPSTRVAVNTNPAFSYTTANRIPFRMKAVDVHDLPDFREKIPE
jgi:hypothetical protein